MPGGKISLAPSNGLAVFKFPNIVERGIEKESRKKMKKERARETEGLKKIEKEREREREREIVTAN